MQLAAERGLSDSCRFPGWLDDPSPFFAIADLFVCPSREEPLGNVILEAWSYQLPVVTTATAAAVELIDSGNNGLVAARQNPVALAAVLKELLEQPVLIAKIKAGGFATLQGQYSKEAIVSAYLDLYKSLL
jgi:glycosyltransferase involved in cell wall biosynthesis